MSCKIYNFWICLKGRQSMMYLQKVWPHYYSRSRYVGNLVVCEPRKFSLLFANKASWVVAFGQWVLHVDAR